MSEVLTTAWSIARSGWRASYNRTWRFSRMKSALIFLVLQAGFFFLIARRSPAAATGSLPGLMALMALQMGWFGLMFGFARGQMQLYQGLLVPLFQITPSRPLSFLLGRVIEAVPTRAWSCLLWAWAYSAAVPGSGRWGALALLAAFGLLVGMAAHLSGLLLLSFWSRYSPKTMRDGSFLFGGLTLAMVTWAIIFLAEGNTVTELALLMREYRPLVYGAVTVLAGIPGLVLMLGLLVRPDWVEDLYRTGLYQVIELGENDVKRSGRSAWLPLPDGVYRAVLSREWLELYRARVARVQLMMFLAATVGVWFAGQAMRFERVERSVLFVGGLALFAWFMSYGHWVVRVFEKERRTMLLYRLAGVPARQLILAKFTSVFLPSAVLVAAATLVGAQAAWLNLPETLRVTGWSLFALAAGTFGGFGMSAATADQGENDASEAGPQQGASADGPQTASSAWWAIARTLALMITAALPLWAGAGLPGLAGIVPVSAAVSVAAVLPLVLLVAGFALMIKSWERI